MPARPVLPDTEPMQSLPHSRRWQYFWAGSAAALMTLAAICFSTEGMLSKWATEQALRLEVDVCRVQADGKLKMYVKLHYEPEKLAPPLAWFAAKECYFELWREPDDDTRLLSHFQLQKEPENQDSDESDCVQENLGGILKGGFSSMHGQSSLELFVVIDPHQPLNELSDRKQRWKVQCTARLYIDGSLFKRKQWQETVVRMRRAPSLWSPFWLWWYGDEPAIGAPQYVPLTSAEFTIKPNAPASVLDLLVPAILSAMGPKEK